MAKKNLYLTFIFSHKKIHGPVRDTLFITPPSIDGGSEGARGETLKMVGEREGERRSVCVQRWRTVGRSRAASKETMAIHLMKISGRMPITPMITDPGIIGMRLRFRIRIRVSRRRSRAGSIRGHESI